jgi:alpha-tubulin suppressor-like RCC1 family protein
MITNLETLKSQLAAKIAAIDSNTDVQELLLLSNSVKEATTDRIVAVNTTNDLPTLQTDLTTFPFPSGSIFYVRSLQVLVISSKSRWIGFDGRVLRSYVPELNAYAWGLANFGQLGTGNTTNRSSPVTVVGGITTWSQLSAGETHGMGLTNTGIAHAWGRNFYGQLGNGTTTSTSSPVTVVGGITNWSQVSAGYRHSLGLTSTGIAYAWGQGTSGKLGGGDQTNRSSPITVLNNITNWIQLSAGGNHSLGVTSTGIAYAWGLANFGQLGTGNTINRSSPVTFGGITNWSQLSAGHAHSLGVTATGIAYGWGRNDDGRLGIGTAISSQLNPAVVVGGITNWSQVSAGYRHSLGLTSTGIAYAWGRNFYGQLGNGTTTSTSSPVTVIGGITNWSQLAAGSDHNLGLTSTGIAYAWGRNNNGQLGTGNTTNISSPVTVVGGITTWSQLSASRGPASGNGSSFHSLGIKVTATVT